MENTSASTAVMAPDTSTLVMVMNWGRVLVRALSTPLSSLLRGSRMAELRFRSASD